MAEILVSAMAWDGGKSGIAGYINSTVRALARNHHLDVLLLEQDCDAFPVKSSHVRIIPVSNRLARPVINMLWHLFILPFRLPKKKYDFLFLPAGNRRLMCRYPFHTITMFHDLSQFHIPGKYDAFRMFYIRKVIPYFLKSCPGIMAVSESTRRDMVNFYKMNPERIHVNYNGYDAEKFLATQKIEKAQARKQAGLNKKYLLYISRIEHPGKNHMGLVKAWEMAPPEIHREYDLVFAGKTWPGGEIVEQYVEQSPVKPYVHFLGFVPDEILPSLYRGAEIYVFPSLFEGFGIPLLEAMACGTPVTCSNCSSLPEIGADAVTCFDPYKTEEIRDRIMELLGDEEKRKELIHRGYDRLKAFDWDRHAAEIMRIHGEGKR